MQIDRGELTSLKVVAECLVRKNRSVSCQVMKIIQNFRVGRPFLLLTI